MAKKLILSQEQMNCILDEDGQNYLGTESDMPTNNALNQTYASEPNGKPKFGKDISDSETNDGFPRLCMLKKGGIYEEFTKSEFESKMISEINQALKNQAIGFVNPATGKKQASSEGALAVQKTEAKKKAQQGVPGAKEKYNMLSQTLDNRRKPVEQMKDSAMARGQEHTHRKHTGTAHSNKKTNIGNITYFE